MRGVLSWALSWAPPLGGGPPPRCPRLFRSALVFLPGLVSDADLCALLRRFLPLFATL